MNTKPRFERAPLAAIFLTLLGLVACVSHEPPSSPTPVPAAAQPAPRLKDYPWMSRARWFRMHADDIEVAATGEGRVLFWGDSITEMWETRGADLWNTHFVPLGALNFGIGGDKTQNLLWRLDHGAIGTLDPEAIILLIGTNNFGLGEATPDGVAIGVRAVVDRLRSAYPGRPLLLLAVFPRGEQPDDPNRRKIAELNQKLAPLEELPEVTFLDCGNRFLLPDGRIDVELMPDFLHPSVEGYGLLIDPILNWLRDNGVE